MNNEALQRLATEAKARADKATPGPWVCDEDGEIAPLIDGKPDYQQEVAGIVSDPVDGIYLDGVFICAARTDVPALADAVLALLAENERLVGTMKLARDDINLEMNEHVGWGQALARLHTALESYERQTNDRHTPDTRADRPATTGAAAS